MRRLRCVSPPRPSRQPLPRLTPRATVLTALVRASGPLGLAALLPPPDRVLASLAGKLPATPDAPDVPHLPLVDSWEDGRFALRDVMGAARERSVREWTLQLLQRYRYVVGACPPSRAMAPGACACALAFGAMRCDADRLLVAQGARRRCLSG